MSPFSPAPDERAIKEASGQIVEHLLARGQALQGQDLLQFPGKPNKEEQHLKIKKDSYRLGIKET